MDIVKLFHEKIDPWPVIGPAEIEEETEPGLVVYRLYMAGTNLATQEVGLTSLSGIGTLANSLEQVFGTSVLSTLPASTENFSAWFARPGKIRVACTSTDKTSLERLVAYDRRDPRSGLSTVIAEKGRALFPSRAHHGFDWECYSASSLVEPVVESIRTRHSADLPTRLFVAPANRMRSEHKFYFEQWSLDAPPEGVTEFRIAD